MKATIAVTTTAGTKKAETRSTSPWIGARERCALATMSTMRDSIVSAPTCSAVITKVPFRLIVPPVTQVALRLFDGKRLAGDHRFIDGRSALDDDAVDRNAVARPHPQPVAGGNSSTWTSASRPSASMRRAVFGARSSNARIAEPVRSRAFSSSTWPTKTSATMTAAASK